MTVSYRVTTMLNRVDTISNELNDFKQNSGHCPKLFNELKLWRKGLANVGHQSVELTNQRRAFTLWPANILDLTNPNVGELGNQWG